MSDTLTHPVSGKLKKLTLEEFLKLFDPVVHNAILDSVDRYPKREALVCFEVLDLGSRNLGHRTSVVAGPENTYTLEDILKPGARLGDVPSRFQYPVAYVDYRPS